MAELDFILQAVTPANHAGAIRTILRLRKPTHVLVSVAYIWKRGLDAVEKSVKPIAGRARFFVGIRNGVTSVQAIKSLLAMNVKVYAVDTGSRIRIFHPKLYLAANAERADVIIGSANLTLGGLHNNIEASTHIKLDLSNAADRAFANEAINGFADMRKKHPRHVFLIKNRRHADELFESGRLTDEEVIPAPWAVGGVKKGKRDTLPPMKLTRAIRSPIKGLSASKPAKTATVPVLLPALSSSSIGEYLVWESKALTERDLSIPSGPGTSPTGSMGLKKGAVKDIDQRHYFRDEVFAHLKWIRDRAPKKWERAQTKFRLVIKHLDYGVFNLKLSHNTNIRSRTYRQNNFMTQLHWGQAKKYVAKRDLLGRTLYLYRKDTSPPEFMIEID
jgi:HKD family nuclease